MQSMNRKISTGVLWNFASLFLSRGATTLFTLVLARFVAPEAFGLIAMAMIVLELATAFVNSGLGQALIRSKEVSTVDICTVFYTNLVLSALAYSLIFWASPYVALFYSQHELALVIQVMGLAVFFNAAKVAQTAVLSRGMNFKAQMKANTVGAFVAGFLAVAAALQGWGVWSVIIQMLCSSAVSALVLWLASQWRPTLQYSMESCRRLLSFGWSLLVEGILDIIFQNSYLLVIGRTFSAEATGLYFFARKVSNLISRQLTDAVQQATFPAFSTLQSDNPALLIKYRQIMQLMMFIVAPIMALLAALASPLFELLLDKRWWDAVPYVQLLCVVGTLYPLHTLNMNLMNVKGRSDLVLKVGLIKKAVNLSLLFLAIPYGVLGIVVSQVIGSFLAVIPNTYYAERLVGYSFLTQVKDIFRPIIAASASGVPVWWLAETTMHVSLFGALGLGVIGAVMYLGVSTLISAEGASLILSQLRKLRLFA